MWRLLSRSFEEYCKKKNIQHALQEARVVQKWPEVVARHYTEVCPTTKVSKIQNNVLYIWVNEPLWIGELEKNNHFFSQRIEEETHYPLKKIVFLYKPFSLK